jgi:hypothetical protein
MAMSVTGATGSARSRHLSSRSDQLLDPVGPRTNLVASKLWPAHDRPRRSKMTRAPHSKLFPAGDRSIWFSVGNCLRAQYDGLAPPVPRHIAALVAQLESLNRAATYVQKPHWLDYDPVALTILVLGIALVELFALMI